MMTRFLLFHQTQDTTITDPNQHSTTYTYDAMGRLADRTDPLQHQETFTYDLDGNPETWTNRDGQVTTQSYDALDRLQQITYADTSSVTYTYDEANRVQQIQDSVSGSIARTFDGFDRMTSESDPNGSIQYTYDAAGRRQTMTVAAQPQVAYTFDDANRLTGVTQSSLTVGIAYDDADRRATLGLPNGLSATYSYDSGDELIGLTYQLGQTTVGDLTYSYDGDGRRTELGGSLARTRLPQALQTSAYDDANRLVQWGSQTLSYDANGNLASDGVTSYLWDARGHLVELDGTTNAVFGYDGAGRRISQTVSGESRSYEYDNFEVAIETIGAGTTGFFTGVGEDERFVANTPSGTETFLVDGLGSTVGLTDSSGNLATQYIYEPFGASASVGAASDNAFGYAGREKVSDLEYDRSRFYSTTLERFISEDPIEFEGGINQYAYVHNDPINFIDPYGTCECSVKVNCRSVHDWKARMVGAQHCYFVVKGRDQVAVTLSGGPDPNNGRSLMSWHTTWNNGIDPSKGNAATDQTVYSSVGSGQTCNDVDCLKRKELEFEAMNLHYGPIRGPNSNTFVMWLAEQCRLSVVPSNALGAGAGIPR